MAQRVPVSDSTPGFFAFQEDDLRVPSLAEELLSRSRNVNCSHHNTTDSSSRNSSSGNAGVLSSSSLVPHLERALRHASGGVGSSPSRSQAYLSVPESPNRRPHRFSASQPEQSTSGVDKPGRFREAGPRSSCRSSAKRRPWADGSLSGSQSIGYHSGGSGGSNVETRSDTKADIKTNNDEDNDDALQFFYNNDFSSPSILSHSSPPHSSTSPEHTRHAHIHTDNMPHFRTRSAAAAELAEAVSPLPPSYTIAGPSLRASGSSSSNAYTAPPRHEANGSHPLPTPSAGSTAASSRSVSSQWGRLRAASGSEETRTSTKRRRNEDAADASRTTLPPISSLFASMGGGSGSSSGNSQDTGSQAMDSQNSRGSGSTGSTSTNSQPRRPTISPRRPKRSEPIVLDDDDLFLSDDGGVEVVNLVDVDRPQAKAEKQEEEEEEADGENKDTDVKDEAVGSETNPSGRPEPAIVRLSELQCVICMDDMSNLTVTHCGHVFCGECLHSSLVTNTERHICPICRTKIEMRTSSMTATKIARSYFPLQLKKRSRVKQGKQPVR